MKNCCQVLTQIQLAALQQAIDGVGGHGSGGGGRVRRGGLQRELDLQEQGPRQDVRRGQPGVHPAVGRGGRVASRGQLPVQHGAPGRACHILLATSYSWDDI